MAIDLKLTSEQKKQMSSFMKVQPTAKVMNPKEKIGDKIPKDFPHRTEKK